MLEKRRGTRRRGQPAVGFLIGACRPLHRTPCLHATKRAGHLRAQAGSEFVLVLTVLLTLFLIFYVLYSNQIVVSNQADENIVTMRVASTVQSAIDYVYLAGDGAEYNTTLQNSNVNVAISDGIVQARSVYGAANLPLLTDNINDTVIYSGNISIRNDHGVIEID